MDTKWKWLYIAYSNSVILTKDFRVPHLALRVRSNGASETCFVRRISVWNLQDISLHVALSESFCCCEKLLFWGGSSSLQVASSLWRKTESCALPSLASSLCSVRFNLIFKITVFGHVSFKIHSVTNVVLVEICMPHDSPDSVVRACVVGGLQLWLRSKELLEVIQSDAYMISCRLRRLVPHHALRHLLRCLALWNGALGVLNLHFGLLRAVEAGLARLPSAADQLNLSGSCLHLQLEIGNMLIF